MTVIQEDLFRDNTKILKDIIGKYWKLEHRPNLVMAMDQQAVNARVGYIYFYPLSNPYRINGIDYETLTMEPSVSMKVSCRFRETMMSWVTEVMRILMSVRRGGPEVLGGYLFIDPPNIRMNNDLSGWYSATIDVTFRQYTAPIMSAGFNDDLNTAIDNGEYPEPEPAPIEYNGERF